MKQLTRELVTGAALLATAYGVTGSETQKPSVPEAVIQLTVQDVDVVQGSFASITSFWQDRISSFSSAAKLVLIGPGEARVCPTAAKKHGAKINGNQGGAAYCAETDETIVSLVDSEPLGHSGTERGYMLNYMVGHELGHAVQKARGEANVSIKSTDSYVLSHELEADCLAGVAIAQLFPETASSTANAIVTHMAPYDKWHGTNTQRAAQFSLGAENNACSAV